MTDHLTLTADLERLRLFLDRTHEIKNGLDREARQKVRRLFQHYRPIGEKARQIQLDLERVKAPRFSVCDLFLSKEERISQVLAALLDPWGRHGQQDFFLKLFIKRINHQLPENQHLSLNRLDQTSVMLEVLTQRIDNAQRRIDIVLINPDWVLGLENKPWTWEQEKQLEDYRNHLEREYQGRLVHMVYLPGDCSRPTTDTQGVTTVVIGYNWSEAACGPAVREHHLSDWLEEAASGCQADNVRLFLTDFTLWIKRTFNNHSIVTGH